MSFQSWTLRTAQRRLARTSSRGPSNGDLTSERSIPRTSRGLKIPALFRAGSLRLSEKNSLKGPLIHPASGVGNPFFGWR